MSQKARSRTEILAETADVIESGCKTVIGQRFKQSGTIWSPKGAKAPLPLRTPYKSNRLEEFFEHLVKDLRQVDCAA